MMRSLLLFILLTTSFSAGADCALYRGRYGYDAIAHAEGDVIYRDRYGYDAVAHDDGNVVYKDRYGYDAIGHTDGDVIYTGRYGYEAAGHTSGCTSEQTSALGAALLALGL